MRALNLKNIRDKKYRQFDFPEGIWKDVLSLPEKKGIWTIQGNEKNGKTWFALQLAGFLSQFEKTDYVSAEEGVDMTFQDAIVRSGLDVNNRKLLFLPYVPLDKLKERLRKKRTARIVFIDNVTFYKEELTYGGWQSLEREFPNKLFIFLAHEEKGDIAPSTAKAIKKKAKITFKVVGLKCFVGGRCPGGILMIDESKCALYHGIEESED